MNYDESVTAWIADLKRGDEQAVEQLWRRYFDRLVRAAGRRLGGAARRVADEEDVAVSVFDSLCRGAEKGRFNQLTDRDDLWRLMVAIASKKAVDQMRRQTSQKRGGGQVRGDSILARDNDVPAGFEQFISDDPTPEFVALVDEQHQQLLTDLRDDTLRRVAQDRLEGYSNEEIAARLDISLRSVERKLKLIRETWSEGLD